MDDPRPQWPHAGRDGDPPCTVRTFSRNDERMPVDAFLRSEGVPTLLPDNNTLSIQPDLYVALGFFKLQVPTSLVPRANELLTDWDQAVAIEDDAEFSPSPLPDGPAEGGQLPTGMWAAAVVIGGAVLFALAVLNASGT